MPTDGRGFTSFKCVVCEVRRCYEASEGGVSTPDQPNISLDEVTDSRPRAPACMLTLTLYI